MEESRPVLSKFHRKTVREVIQRPSMLFVCFEIKKAPGKFGSQGGKGFRSSPGAIGRFCDRHPVENEPSLSVAEMRVIKPASRTSVPNRQLTIRGKPSSRFSLCRKHLITKASPNDRQFAFAGEDVSFVCGGKLFVFGKRVNPVSWKDFPSDYRQTTLLSPVKLSLVPLPTWRHLCQIG